MQEFMNRIKERISNGVLDSDVWLQDLLMLEKSITQWLDEKGYDAVKSMNDRSQIFDDSTDSRLAYAEQLLQIIQTNKNKGLIQGVRRVQTQMEEILEYYNIGYISDLYLKHTGMYIKLGLGINQSSFMDEKKETQRIKHAKQLEIINDYGFELILNKFTNSTREFKNTDKNKTLLLELLGSIGISHIEFHSSEVEISAVSGWVDLQKLFSYEIQKLNILVDKETEKKNKLILLDKRFRELYDSIATVNLMPNMIHTCGYLVEHYLADIYEILDIDTALCQKVKNYHKNERLKNQKIREIDTKIGKELSDNELSKLGTSFFNQMGYKSLKELGFDICHETSYIGPYNVKLNYRALSVDHMIYSFDSYERIAEEDEKEGDDDEEKTIKFIERTFDLIEPFREERYIAYTEKNANYIMSWVNENFHTAIETLEIGNKKNSLYIKSFSVLLDNLGNI